MQEDAQKLQQPPLEQDLSGWPDDPLLLRAAPLPSLHMQPGVNPCAIQINDGRWDLEPSFLIRVHSPYEMVFKCV